jgi:CBS domain-containing protein
MNIGQLMTRNPRTCTLDDPLGAAAQIMWDHDCGCVPIVDGDGKAIGMITDRDVCMAAYTQGKSLWEMAVSTAASHGVICVREDESLDAAESLMRLHKIRRLPVLDGEGRLVGILSMNDLARRAHLGHRQGDLGADAIARTLAAVCAPNGHATAAAE